MIQLYSGRYRERNREREEKEIRIEKQVHPGREKRKIKGKETKRDKVTSGERQREKQRNKVKGKKTERQ